MRKNPRAHTHSKEKRETPAVVFFWIFGLAFSFYVIARFGLATYPHPYHWASMLVGAVVGYPAGWLWYRWRGDVF